MPKTVAIDPKKVVIVTEDHGGYLAGECIACNALGWLEPRYGYPYRVKGTVIGSGVVHKKGCPMNKVLNDDGTFKK